MIVTTTAMPRPDLLVETYRSFQSNLRGVDWKQAELRINIDPTDDNELALDTLRVGGLFFPKVTAHLPPSPSFPLALKRVWSDLPDSDEWVLHLEDDWRLDVELDVEELEAFAHRHSWAKQIGLRSGPKANHHQLVLSPSLIRASFAKKAASLLTGTRNPEQELRSYADFQFCMAYFPFEDNVIVTDLGTSWREANGYRREGDAEFIQWKRRN